MTFSKSPALAVSGSTRIKLALLAAGVAALPRLASADTYTWTGNGTDNRVSLGANWSGGTAPSSIATTDSWVFGTSNRYFVDIITNRTAGSLTFNDAAAYTFSDAILTVGGINQNSTGTEIFNNVVNVLSSQTWTLANGAGSMAFTKGVGLNSTLTIAPGGTNTIGCNFSGSGGLTVDGTGTLTLNGTSTYTGDTNINAGTLRITATSGLLNTALHVGGGTLLLDGGVFGDASAPLAQAVDSGSLQINAGYFNASSLRVSNTGTSGTVTQSGGAVAVTGDIGVGNSSTGMLGFGGTGTYNLSGGTVSAGSLSLGGDRNGTLNQSGGSVSVNSMWMTSGATASGLTNSYNLSAGSLTTNGLTMASGNLTYGTGVITQTGGVLTVNGNIFYATGLASGSYALNGGELHVNDITGSISFFNTPAFGLNGGTLFVGADNAAFGSVVKQWNVGAGGAKIDTAAHTVTLGGTLVSAATADGGLTKSGAGTLTVSSPTYNGPTAATGGTLKITNLTTASPVTASNGSTVQLTNSTITLPASKFETANAGSAIAYDNTTVNASLTGVGTHHVLAGGATFNNSVFTTGTNLMTDGATTLNNVTSTATITANAPLTWNIGSNTLGTLNANAAVTTSTWYNTGNINISSTGSLTNNGTTLLIGGGSRVTIATGGALTTTAGTIELNGALLTNNGAVHGTLDVNYGSTLKGSGTFDAVHVTDGGIFSPGNSPGTATVASATFDAGGNYQFEINSAAATPGNGADLLNVTGALDITAGATANSQFVIRLTSLNGSNQSAALADFDPKQNYTFTLATAGSISGFEADRFFVDTTAFRNTYDGTFGVTQVGNALVLNYTAAVPEPASLAIVGIGMVIGLRRRRR